METLDLDDDPDLVVIEAYITSARRAYRSPTTTAPAAPTSASAGCTRRACRRRPPRTPTACSAAPARTRGRRSSPTSAPAAPSRSTARPSGRSPASRRRAATSSSASATSCRTRSSSRAAARTSATSATRRRSSRGGRSFYVQRGRRRARGDRPPARPAPLLPRRQPVRQPAVRRGALRRDARHGPRVAGGRHGGGGAASRPAREGRGVRAAQPVRRLRDARARRTCAAHGKTQNLGGRAYDAAVRRLHDLGRDGQRQLRLRHGPRRPVGVRPHGRVGGRAGASRRRRSTS